MRAAGTNARLATPLPIAQGGTGQAAKAAAFDALSPTTTNGDTIIRASGTNARLAIGSEGEFYTVSSSLPAWVANGAGGTTLKGILSGAKTGSFGYLTPDPGSSATLMEGGLWDQVHLDATSALVWGSDGLAFQQGSGGVSGNYTYIVAESSPQFQAGSKLILCWKFKMVETTSKRFVAGYTSVTEANTFGTDDPAGEYAMLQYSTARPDTNFQFVTRDAGGTQQISDSGIAVDTSVHYVIVELTGTSVVFKLYDSGFSQQGSTVTHSTNIPTSTTALQPIMGTETLTNAARSQQLLFANILSGA